MVASIRWKYPEWVKVTENLVSMQENLFCHQSVLWKLVRYAILLLLAVYRNDPKFSDRYAWENSAPSSLILRIYTVFQSVCTIWTHYSMVEPQSSNFRVITANFLGVRYLGNFC